MPQQAVPGEERAVVNICGGNTGAKLPAVDHVGRVVEVLWVKGSDVDLAIITEQGCAEVPLADILPLADREPMSDEEILDYLAHCAFASTARGNPSRPGEPARSRPPQRCSWTPPRHPGTHRPCVRRPSGSPPRVPLAPASTKILPCPMDLTHD